MEINGSVLHDPRQLVIRQANTMSALNYCGILGVNSENIAVFASFRFGLFTEFEGFSFY